MQFFPITCFYTYVRLKCEREMTMVNSANSLPIFNEVKFVTKDGESISATKNNGVVTVVGDKNGVRQLPTNDFMKYMVENAQNIDLERKPQNDEVAFKSNNVSRAERMKAYRDAEPSKGTKVLGLASLSTMALTTALMVSNKFCKFLDKNKAGRIALLALDAAAVIGTGVAVIKADKEKRAILKEQNMI